MTSLQYRLRFLLSSRPIPCFNQLVKSVLPVRSGVLRREGKKEQEEELA